jgi:hypothetical protein
MASKVYTGTINHRRSPTFVTSSLDDREENESDECKASPWTSPLPLLSWLRTGFRLRSIMALLICFTLTLIVCSNHTPLTAQSMQRTIKYSRAFIDSTSDGNTTKSHPLQRDDSFEIPAHKFSSKPRNTNDTNNATQVFPTLSIGRLVRV